MEVRRAHVAQKALLETLLEKYLYELSFFEGERFGEDGTFGYPYLAAYWQEEGRHPYLLYADGRLSGLCLVNRIPAADAPLDHAVAEFFVAPPDRRQGAASAAIAQVFARHPGAWQIAFHEKNAPAAAFWRRAARTHACPACSAFPRPEPAKRRAPPVLWRSATIRLFVPPIVFCYTGPKESFP